MMRNKTLWGVALVALLFVGGASSVQALGLSEYQEQVDAIVIEDVDLQQVPDGRHFGTYDTNLVSAEVAVTVLNNRIHNIEILRHATGRGSSGEGVKDRVIEAQSLDVDTIARATASSKIILKAIEVALTDAKAQ
ncbi:MAG: FMN-binding protein [Spirochaetaceae bacterium]|nr:MAG: FMN-binding protein [Spirochaetaceae bacterium]